jgi:hypothetical protein
MTKDAPRFCIRRLFIREESKKPKAWTLHQKKNRLFTPEKASIFIPFSGETKHKIMVSATQPFQRGLNNHQKPSSRLVRVSFYKEAANIVLIK